MQNLKENSTLEIVIYTSIFSILNKNLRSVAFLILFLFSYSFSAGAQDFFQMENNGKNFKLPFELVNNLVVIPVEINGVELSFLLDTGVNSTILFSIGDKDSLNLKNSEVIYLRGLGAGEPVKALKSSGNEMTIGEAYNKDLVLYMVYDNPISLSNRMGIPIHGIIGYDFFKDFIIEFNYPKKQLIAHKPGSFEPKNCRNCVELDLKFERNKPYVTISGEIEDKTVPLNLLIDSGSGDALWIFADKSKNIELPEKCFEDFLGFGMAGSVYGQRSRIKSIEIGGLKMSEITASFPDSIYYKGIATFGERNGSLGAQILSRFKVTFDYPGNKITLKPNKNFSKPFEYDMSGVVIAHEGFVLIQDLMRNPLPIRENDANNTTAGNLVYKSTYNTKYSLKPQYKIVEIRPTSPAERAGLKLGDLIVKINGKKAYNYSLSQISGLMSSTDGKRIRMVVERDGKEQKLEFKLERIL